MFKLPIAYKVSAYTCVDDIKYTTEAEAVYRGIIKNLNKEFDGFGETAHRICHDGYAEEITIAANAYLRMMAARS